MTRTVLNRTAASRRGRTLPTARVAHASACEAADALDRSTAWPVHRIRWFLLSQPAPTQRRSPAV